MRVYWSIGRYDGAFCHRPIDQYTQGMPYFALGPTMMVPPPSTDPAGAEADVVGDALRLFADEAPPAAARPAGTEVTAEPIRISTCPAGSDASGLGGRADLGRDLGRVGRRASAVEHLIAAADRSATGPTRS